MGGISVLVLLSAMGFFALAFLSAIALFVAAIVVAIVFAVRTPLRRQQGKKLGGLIAIPIVLFVLSLLVIVPITATVVIPAYQSSTTTTYSDCSNAVVTHDADRLDQVLDAPDLNLEIEGQESYRNLLRLTIIYGDAECAETILVDAEEKGLTIDLNQPLIDYDIDGNATDSEYALIMATSTHYSSLEMMNVLIEYGADPSIQDETGLTPWDHYCKTLDALVRNNEITAKEKENALAEMAQVLAQT